MSRKWMMPCLASVLAVVSVQSLPAFSQPPAGARQARAAIDADSARQVNVEILFVEIVAAKDWGKVKLDGEPGAIEKSLQQLKQAGHLKGLQRIRLSALSGRTASTQIGETRAVLSDRGDPRRRGFSRSYSRQNFGTMVSVTPSVASDGDVVMELTLEKSGLQGEASPMEEGETASPPGTRTMSISNALRVKPGRFVVVTSSARRSKSGLDRVVVIAKADTGPGATAAPPQVVVMTLKHAAAAEAVKIVAQVLGGRSKTSVTADERTNSIIARGSLADVKIIEAILMRLDVPKPK